MTNQFQDAFRPAQAGMSLHSVFTNRVDELAAFARALDQHAAWCASGAGGGTARENVLNFFGVGGIGKTSLLRQLMAHVAKRQDEPTAVMYLDFHEASAFNTEDMILRLRTAVGALGKPCVAFDIALAFYWSTVHPGTTLEMYTRSHSLLERISERIGLSDCVEDAVQEVASAIGAFATAAGGGLRLVQSVAQTLRRRSQVRHAVSGCAALPMFLDPENVEMSLTYLPALLSWDLDQMDQQRVVVFLDTYEAVTARGRETERVVQRLCYLLPNVLFVIAGRNRLDWHRDDLIGALDYTGRSCWPQLAEVGTAGSTAILLGDLSPVDADQYLCDRISLGCAPAIPHDVRTKIIEAAHGWPLYLDLAAMHFLQVGARGADATQFGEPFQALVSRVLSDLTETERTVIRSAALFDHFDVAMVRAAAGDASHALVESTLQRPFFRHDPSAPLAYSLHETLRSALRRESVHAGSWAEADWHDAAVRAVRHLGDRVLETDDRIVLGSVVDQGLQLCHQFGLPTEWISASSRRLAALGALESVRPIGGTGNAAALSRLLHVVSRRARTRFVEHADELGTCAADPDLHPVDAFWGRALQGDALLSGGSRDIAESVYREILSDPPDSSIVSWPRTMLALSMLKRSAFVELATYVAEHGDEVDSNRLLGDVYRHNALWADARASYESGLEIAAADGDAGLEALFRAELALLDGWTRAADPSIRSSSASEGVETWTLCSFLIAVGLYHAPDDRPAAEKTLAEAELLASDFGMLDGIADTLVARGYLAAIHGDSPLLAECADRLRAMLADTDEYRHWVEVLDAWQEVLVGTSTVQWLDGRDAAMSRWRDVVVEARRNAR